MSKPPNVVTGTTRKARALTQGLIIVALGVALAGIALETTPGTAASPSAEARVLPVATQKATLQSGYTVRREFLGRVEARRESRIGFELGGLVTEILVDEGDLVDAGQVIARLDVDRLEIRVKQLHARRAELHSLIELAEATRGRQEKLTDRGHASQQRYDETRFNEQALRSQLVQVEAQIDLVELDIEKSRIISPFDAIVAKRLVDEGTVIATGTPVFELLERQNPEVRIGIAGDSIDRVAIGQVHTLEIRGRSVQGTVRSVLPVRDRATRSVDVLLALDVPFNGIRRGDLARLELERNVDEPGFWLPITALTESSLGLWAVYVVTVGPGEESELERRQLEVLHQETDRAFVRGTLTDDQQVVVGGLHRLVPGQLVRVTPSTSHFTDVEGEKS